MCYFPIRNQVQRIMYKVYILVIVSWFSDISLAARSALNTAKFVQYKFLVYTKKIVHSTLRQPYLRAILLPKIWD